MFLLNSRLSRFTAAPLRGHPLSRSYGVILPSSLTRVIPRALGFSPCLPVSVFSTGALEIAPCGALEAFLGSVGHTRFGTLISLPIALQNSPGDLPPGASFALGPEPTPGRALLTASPHRSPRRYRNIHLLSIAYANGLGLGPD